MVRCLRFSGAPTKLGLRSLRKMFLASDISEAGSKGGKKSGNEPHVLQGQRSIVRVVLAEQGKIQKKYVPFSLPSPPNKSKSAQFS